MKVLIVDDERRTRETLRDMVDWSALGVASTRLAKNGEEALSLALEWRPDLVLTDVRMPRMDGIELAKALRASSLSCRILFLSAYTDTDYLKEAIRVRAEDYLEKPIDLDAISRSVRDAIAEIKLDRNSLSSREHRLESLGQDLLAKSIPLAEFSACYGAVSGHEPFSRWRPLALRLHAVGESRDSDRARIRKELLALFNSASSPLPSILLLSPGRSSTLFALVGDDEGRAEEAASSFARIVAELYPFSLTPRVGLGPSVGDSALIPPAYDVALDALTRGFYLGELVVSLDAALGREAVVPLDEAALDAALAGGGITALAALVSTSAERDALCSSPDLEALRSRWAEFLRRALAGSPLYSASESERLYAASLPKIEEAISLAALSDMVLGLLREAFSPEGGVQSREKVVGQVKSLIRSRYMDSELSVEALSREVGLSVAYLCTLFKRTSGMTIKEYLDSVRMDAAKAALRTSDDKLVVIASRVGFRDANHFSVFFKAHSGLTPREFRSRPAS